MKWMVAGFTLCSLIIAAVIFNLVTNGVALRSAGVIKPTLIGSDDRHIAKSLALRLFPDFQTYKNVVWVPEPGLENRVDELLSLTRMKLKEEQTNLFPEFIKASDVESKEPVPSSETYFWWQFPANWEPKLKSFKQILGYENFVVIFISTFERNHNVPTKCEDIKILTHECLRDAAVREVRKKLKSSEPYFFMRRYQANEFYLFIEKQ
jgi:hypothetical protein